MSNEQITEGLGNTIISAIAGTFKCLKHILFFIKKGLISLFSAFSTGNKYILFAFMLTIIASIILILAYGIAFAFMPPYALYCIGHSQSCKKRSKNMKGGRKWKK